MKGAGVAMALGMGLLLCDEILNIPPVLLRNRMGEPDGFADRHKGTGEPFGSPSGSPKYGAMPSSGHKKTPEKLKALSASVIGLRNPIPAIAGTG